MNQENFRLQQDRITEKQWKHDLNKIQVTKQDLDKLVMNYFLVEGHKDAALKFQEESGTKISENDLKSMEPRLEIKQLINNGQIDQAIEKVQNINKEVFSDQSEIIFELKLQKLIELVKENKINEVIEYAQTELLPVAEQNDKHLQQIEAVMSLLAFQDIEKSPNKFLIEDSQKKYLTSEINQEILKVGNSEEKDCKLPTLIKLLFWSQQRLAEKIDFPMIKECNSPTLVNSQDYFNNSYNLNNSLGSIKHSEII